MRDVHDLLLDELEDDERCWCDQPPEECAKNGGCRWTRELADRQQQLRQQIVQDLRRAAKGRLHYSTSCPAGPERAHLLVEAAVLKSAALIAEGDRQTMCALLPVAMWTDTEHATTQEHKASEGHPYGCPRSPEAAGAALRPCYCGQTMVLAPAWLGPCCESTPPVRIPGGCALCGDDRCRICDPDDEPESYSGDGGSWVHARCGDRRFSSSPEYLASRRAKRITPLGVIAP